jgi:phosphoribosylformimino-5-aminoimidazole carboxamide ribotide isomerase
MIQIIPAIDIIEGKCVRLAQGDYRLKKVYGEDPLEVARRFQDNGIKRLHLVDLDGARDNLVINWNTLEHIASKTDLIIDFGGGIKTIHDLKIVFESGASMAVIGSIAVHDQDLFQTWLFAFGRDKIILGADVKNKKIAVSGWTEVTEIELYDFLREYADMGVKRVLCTDIEKDGMLEGTSLEMYADMVRNFSNLEIIASGGITTVDELHALNETRIAGAVIGKALYEGTIRLEDLKEFLL